VPRLLPLSHQLLLNNGLNINNNNNRTGSGKLGKKNGQVGGIIEGVGAFFIYFLWENENENEVFFLEKKKKNEN
jgi:hypothetical protein